MRDALNIAAFKVGWSDYVGSSATRTLHVDLWSSLEEFFELVLPNREGWHNPSEVAPTMKVEVSILERRKILGFGEGCDLFGGQSFKPFLIEIRLRSEKHIVLIRKFDNFSGALFGLVIEVLQPCLLYTSPSPRDRG